MSVTLMERFTSALFCYIVYSSVTAHAGSESVAPLLDGCFISHVVGTPVCRCVYEVFVSSGFHQTLERCIDNMKRGFFSAKLSPITLNLKMWAFMNLKPSRDLSPSLLL